MADGMFIRKQDQDVPGGMRHPVHKMAQILDAEDPSRYDFGALQHAVTGTRVPLTTEHGGIMKSNNPFGKVVQGEEIRYAPNGRSQSVDYTPTWIQDAIREDTGMEVVPLAPEPDPDRGDAEAEAKADAQVEAQRRQLQVEAEDAAVVQRAAEEELKRIMAAAEARKPNTVFKVPTPSAIPSPLPVLGQEPIRIKMQGAFGTYKGHCFAYQVEDNMVVLIYGADTETFSPPPSPTPFRLSCGKENFDVYFAGIEFELPIFNCSVQVLIRSQ